MLNLELLLVLICILAIAEDVLIIMQEIEMTNGDDSVIFEDAPWDIMEMTLLWFHKYSTPRPICGIPEWFPGCFLNTNLGIYYFMTLIHGDNG